MSNTIITSIFWVRKGWAKAIPLEYEEINSSSKMKEVTKINNKLKKEGKLTGNETIKETTQIISDNIETSNRNANGEEGSDMPVFCEDLKKYYTESEMQIDQENTNKNDYPENFDDISDEEEEDFTIHPTDSLIVCGTAQDDFSNLEIYIYDEENLGLFVHHDIVLSSFPLSIEWLPYKDNAKANYAIVGTFDPYIEIWNLDMLDVLEPEITLGRTNNKNKSENSLCHSDAVMSISLNPVNPNIVASGSADSKILLWDLNVSPDKALRAINTHKDKVQCVKWNKCEDNILVSGSFDKTIVLDDVRNQGRTMTIKVNSDIENIDWSLLNKFHFLASFETGRIELFDIRKNDPILSFDAHKKEATSVSFSNQQEALFASVGRDSKIKLWDSANIINDNQPTLITEVMVKKSTGELFSCKFADDCHYTLGVGGSKGELYIWQLEQNPIFCSRFGLQFEEPKIPQHLKNVPKNKRLGKRNKKK